MRFPLWARLRVVFFLSSVVGGCPFEEFEAFFHLPPIVTFSPFIVSGPLAATEEIKPQDAHILSRVFNLESFTNSSFRI